MKEYQGLEYRGRRFDCAHLMAKYFKEEFDLDTSSWNEVSRYYDIRNERQYIQNQLVEHGFVELPLESDYQKGDVIIYLFEGVGTCCLATCINSDSAIVMNRRSHEMLIKDIPKKLNHFRHKIRMKN